MHTVPPNLLKVSSSPPWQPRTRISNFCNESLSFGMRANNNGTETRHEPYIHKPYIYILALDQTHNHLHISTPAPFISITIRTSSKHRLQSPPKLPNPQLPSLPLSLPASPPGVPKTPIITPPKPPVCVVNGVVTPLIMIADAEGARLMVVPETVIAEPEERVWPAMTY